MLKLPAGSRRLNTLKTIACLAAVVLSVKVLLTILLEYRFYFPADFDATFLIGRRESFTGVYAAAFYVHILTAPLALVLGACLMWSGGRGRYVKLHHWGGRVQIVLILAAVVPSGLVMAGWAFAGPIAGAGFAVQSLATAACAILAVRYAMARQFAIHRQWASRCFILLAAPLLFRLISGGLIVLQVESPESYQANAWISWILPLAVYETRRVAGRLHTKRPVHQPSPLSQEAVP